VGPITPSTVIAAAESNFGDTGISQPLEKGAVVSDILRILQEGPKRLDCVRLQSFVRTHYDIRIVERKVASVYQRAFAPALIKKPIPVLMYHRVVHEAPVGSRHGIWVTESQFETQLRSLKDRGYTPMTLRQYRLCSDGKEVVPPKPVVLTFDDGYEDNYVTAFPLLQKYSFPAVIFLVADFLHRTNFWDRDEPVVPLLKCSQIQEMDRGGIEFGSHTLSHPHLSTVSSEQLHEELVSSKKAVENLTGREVLSLAYPYGDLNGEVKSVLSEAGYAYGVATDSGPLSLQDDLREIRRIPVFPGTDRLGFWKKTHPWYTRYRSALGK
jgi:peptidoglycan/xylan/chitin deacetylase (PgdA/CDA1 family)